MHLVPRVHEENARLWQLHGAAIIHFSRSAENPGSRCPLLPDSLAELVIAEQRNAAVRCALSRREERRNDVSVTSGTHAAPRGVEHIGARCARS